MSLTRPPRPTTESPFDAAIRRLLEQQAGRYVGAFAALAQKDQSHDQRLDEQDAAISDLYRILRESAEGAGDSFAPGTFRVIESARTASGVPAELADVASCADEFEADDDAEALQLVIRLKRKLLGEAAQTARSRGLRAHAQVLSLLQTGLPLVKGEGLTAAQRGAIAYACRLVGQPGISRGESQDAERRLRRAGMSILGEHLTDLAAAPSHG